MAVGRDLAGEDYNVIAVIGDGSFTSGVVYEALNNIGANKTNVNIVLNDNGMSISHNVGALSKYLNRVRVSQKYDQAKVSVKSALGNVPLVGGAISKGLRSSVPSRQPNRPGLIPSEGNRRLPPTRLLLWIQ
jgi:1-deoxy-D-xylulose-5-phosphate synthase